VEQSQQYVGIDLHRRRSVIVRRRVADGASRSAVVLIRHEFDRGPVVLQVQFVGAGQQTPSGRSTHANGYSQARGRAPSPSMSGNITHANVSMGIPWEPQ